MDKDNKDLIADIKELLRSPATSQSSKRVLLVTLKDLEKNGS
jgi:hypothetical protein